MLSKLVKLADKLDKLGLESGANEIDNIIVNYAGMFDFFKREREVSPKISPEILSAVEKYFNKINEDNPDYRKSFGNQGILGELREVKAVEKDGSITYQASGSNYELDCWVITPEDNESYKKEFGEDTTYTAWDNGVPIENSDDRIYGEW